MAGVAGGLGSIDVILRYYGFTRQDVVSWGGKILKTWLLLARSVAPASIPSHTPVGLCPNL